MRVEYSCILNCEILLTKDDEVRSALVDDEKDTCCNGKILNLGI